MTARAFLFGRFSDAPILEVAFKRFDSLAEDSFYRLEIAVAVEVIRLEIAGLGPLVPAVYSHKLMLLGVTVEVILCEAETLFEVFGGIVFGNAAAEAFEAGVIVPTYRNVREIDIFGVIAVDKLILTLNILEDFEVIAVHVCEVCELVMSRAVEAHFFELCL